MFLKFTDVTEIVDETFEEEECKTIEEEICSQPTPQFGEKCQDVEVSTVQIFWEGHKDWKNLTLCFDIESNFQKIWEICFKFCDLRTLSEL